MAGRVALKVWAGLTEIRRRAKACEAECSIEAASGVDLSVLAMRSRIWRRSFTAPCWVIVARCFCSLERESRMRTARPTIVGDGLFLQQATRAGTRLASRSFLQRAVT